ncbi:YihY/virulence factor BrkB family protein [Steroidobacter cummioxidans]|uniref:YihY/virulence factor BrkB family protein n=1 Tax=Steroidobacter cummioxidans TaxID=1803913 RepID=UPI000E30BD3A|nr:YihY/virulence factor BrkB family protein [Steroidobacter cummioxidans]
MIALLLARLEHWLFEPPESIIGRPLWKLTRILRYPYALIRDITLGELTLRAMSLVYTTLLSIVPIIALSFSVLKGLGYHRELEPVLYSFLEPLGDRAYEITQQVMGFVDNVRGGVLGSLGLMFLLYYLISTVQKVEESFNFVWRVEQPRSIGRRFSEYLSVMVVGPVVIVSAFGLMATLGSSSFVQTLSHYRPFDTVVLLLGRLTPYLLVSGVFTFMYAFVPNTKVRMSAALIGGVAAGAAWAFGGMVMARFVSSTTTTTIIYAGFAIVVAALIWVYISWLILLLGAQLGFYVQNPQYLRPGRGVIALNSSLRERVALSIMYLIVNDYRTAQHRWTVNRLADHLDLPGAALTPIMDALEERKLLLVAEDDSWVPARDPHAIELNDVLDAVRHDTAGPRLAKIRDIAPAVEAARIAEQALQNSLKGKTVAELVEQTNNVRHLPTHQA